MVLENEVDWEENPSFLDMCKSQLDDFFMEMSCYFYIFLVSLKIFRVPSSSLRIYLLSPIKETAIE